MRIGAMATAIVFQYSYAGTTYTIAMEAGAGGWTLIAQSAAGADDVELQAAIDYLADGQTLLILSGQYNLNSALSITKPVNVVGEGLKCGPYWEDPTGTVLIRTGDIIDYNVAAGDTYNVRIENIALLGDWTSHTGTMLKLTNFHGMVNNVLVKGGEYGIDLINCWAANFYNVYAPRNEYGIQLGSQSNNIDFFSCKFTGNQNSGVIVNGGSEGLGFIGCLFEENGQYGINLDYATIRVVTIDHCYFAKNPTWAVGAVNNGAHIRINISNPTCITISNCFLARMDQDVNIVDADRILIDAGKNILVENTLFLESGGNVVYTDIDNNQGADVNMVLLNCAEDHDGGWVIEGLLGIKAIKTVGLVTEYARMLQTCMYPAPTDNQPAVVGRIYFIPFQVEFTLTIDALGFASHNVVAGNCRLGIYADAGDTPETGVLLGTTGDQAIPAAAISAHDFALAVPAQLLPGLYWFAAEFSDATNKFYSMDSPWCRGGVLNTKRFELGAYLALPDPCPAGLTNDFVKPPLMYALVSSVP